MSFCTSGEMQKRAGIAQALTHNQQVQRSKTCCCSERKCRKIIPGVAQASVQIGEGRGPGCSDMPGCLGRRETATASLHISGNYFSKDHKEFLLVCEFANSEYLWFCYSAL